MRMPIWARIILIGFVNVEEWRELINHRFDGGIVWESFLLDV